MNTCTRCKKLFNDENYIRHMANTVPCDKYCIGCERWFQNSYLYMCHRDFCSPRPIGNRYNIPRSVRNDILSCLPNDLQLYVYRSLHRDGMLQVQSQLFEDMVWYDNGDGFECYMNKYGNRLVDCFWYQYPYIPQDDEDEPLVERIIPYGERRLVYDRNNKVVPRPVWCSNPRLDGLEPVLRLNYDVLKTYGVTWSYDDHVFFNRPIKY